MISSSKQAHGIRDKAVSAVSGDSHEKWAERFEAITAEHREEGARDQLADGWKTWLAAQNPAAAAAGVAASAAAAGRAAGGSLSQNLWTIRLSGVGWGGAGRACSDEVLGWLLPWG